MNALFSALLLAGAAVAAPTTRANETCAQKSSQISDWTVENFDFHASYIFTNPAHQNSWGYVNFTLQNDVLDYKAECTSSSNWLNDFYYGNIAYNCTVPVEADEATFTFSRPSGELQINQTWNCLDEGSYYMAEGGITLDLDCEDETWENPDWELGQIYSTRYITCGLVTVEAPIESIRGVA